MSSDAADVTVIGAGPVGLFALFACGRKGLKCHSVDALDFIGGQCAALYPEKYIYDIPAIPRIKAEDLISSLQEQIAPFQPTFHLGQRAQNLRECDNGFEITTDQGKSWQTKTVLIAGGAGCFQPKRPDIPDIENYEGQSVFYHVQKQKDFKDKRIVIAGGGDSAVDWAIALTEVAREVHVIHRRAQFRSSPDTLEVLKQKVATGHIKLHVPYQLDSLEGESPYLSHVIIKHISEGHTTALEAEALLPFFGLETQLGPLSQWDLMIEKNKLCVDPSTCRTNRSGIYAIGDMASYDKKLKLILSGFAEAEQAAHAIYAFIYPDRSHHFAHSTSTGVSQV